MALEKQANSGMPLKQKALIGAVVVIFLVVGWQVVGLMGIGSRSAPPPPVVTKPNQNAKSAGAVSSPMTNRPSTGNNSQPVQQAAHQEELKQAQVVNDPAFLQQQQANEQKYIGKVNDLEDLKIQRAIAETNQAIATAKLATVTAEKNISDLLTKPANTMPEVPAGAKVVSGAPGESGAGLPPFGALLQVQYTVISVSMQLGKWNAVIGFQGKLYNVIVGDVLTPDNSVVASINKNGVMLRKNGQSRKVSIMSPI